MSDSSPFVVACARAGNMQTKKLDSYMASTNADGYSLSDLPLKDLGTTRVKAAVDIVKVPRGCVVTQESLLTGLNERNMDALPDIVKPQAECPVPFDFQIVMSNDVMLKHFIFTDKVDVRLFKSMCIGDPQGINYGTKFRNGTQAFQYLLQNITGWGCFCYETNLKDAKKKSKAKPKTALEEGFAFIRDEGPRSNIHNRQTEWTEIEIHREDSPIFGWSAGLVKESLKGYGSSNVFVEPVADFFLTLKDLRAWFLEDCLAPVIPDMKDKTLVMMGLANRGKTPVAQALSMAMSEYWLLVDQKDDEMLPSFRLAASLDQLRGDPGIKYRPDILDDADTSMVPVAKLKSFLDSSVAEAFTVERWTAAKFVRNQLRIICVPRLCFTHFCLQYCLASAVVEFCCVCETQEIFRASCNLSPEGSLMVWNPRAIGKSPSNNPF